MRSARTIHFALVDDHALFREGFKDLICHSRNFELQGEGSDGFDALKLAAEPGLDVLIIDLRLPRFNGLAALKRIRRSNVTLKIVVVTMYNDEDTWRAARLAGADAIFSKMENSRTIMKTIEKIVKERSGRGRKQIRHDVEDQAIDESGEELSLLTETEYRLLEGLERGKSNSDLAALMFSSERTVKNQLNVLFKKLKVKSRFEAVKKGIKKNLIAFTTE